MPKRLRIGFSDEQIRDTDLAFTRHVLVRWDDVVARALESATRIRDELRDALVALDKGRG